MINGINNPIASISSVTATDPVTQQVVTIPGNTPVVGATQPWFSGRVYGPQAAWASPTTVNLIFAGYNATYSADLSDYRTIGRLDSRLPGQPFLKRLKQPSYWRSAKVNSELPAATATYCFPSTA